MKNIHQKYYIKASAAQVWKALVDPASINEWGGGPAKMSDKVGAKFSLWDGQIHGKNLEVKPMKKLKQEWYADYDTPSFVTFTLSEKDVKSVVELVHTDIPDDKHKDIEAGWKEYYMEPLKGFVEGLK